MIGALPCCTCALIFTNHESLHQLILLLFRIFARSRISKHFRSVFGTPNKIQQLVPDVDTPGGGSNHHNYMRANQLSSMQPRSLILQFLPPARSRRQFKSYCMFLRMTYTLQDRVPASHVTLICFGPSLAPTQPMTDALEPRYGGTSPDSSMAREV
jgi:hypothetical protein